MSDNTSFLVGTVLGVLGIAAGAYFYWIGRSRKTLDWEMVGRDAIVKVAAAQSVNLEVRWNGREVVHPALATIRLINTGKEAISASDLVEPIRITLSEGELLSADITDKPTGDFLHEPTSQDSRSVAVAPKLLNPSESFTIQLLLEAEKPEISVAARIAGLSRPIRHVVLDDQRDFRRVIPLVTLAFALTVTVALLASADKPDKILVYSLGGVGIAICILGLMIVGRAIMRIHRSPD